jgi:Zinc finger, C3HC4 type (RING finger)
VDFGEAVRVPGGGDDDDLFIVPIDMNKQVGGNVAHLAPEFHNARKDALHCVPGGSIPLDASHQAIWELGVLVWEVLVGEHPFNGYPDAYVHPEGVILPTLTFDVVAEFLDGVKDADRVGEGVVRAMMTDPEVRGDFSTLVEQLQRASTTLGAVGGAIRVELDANDDASDESKGAVISTDGSVASGQTGDEEKLCSICEDSKADTALLQCGHAMFCNACALKVIESSGECPICRSPVDKALRIFT